MSAAAPSAAPTVGAFEAHLREAIALNRERLPRYAALSGGASLPLSRTLIRAETLALPVARAVDRRAAPFQARGVGIVADEFIAMANTPPFREHAPIDAAGFRRQSGWRLGWRVARAFRAGGFAAAENEIARELRRLESAPGVHCMLRHLLESARRVCRLAPVHAARAAELGIESPEPLSRRLLWLHLLALPAAARLDARAFPLQARGIPILAQDVPPIPPGP